MVTAKKLPSGMWRTRVFVGKDASGKAQYVSITRKTQRECVRDALEIATRHKEVSRDASTMTLAEAIDAYLESKSNVLSPATIRGYDQIKRNHFQPEMKEKLCKLTKTKLQAAVNREALTCSPKTVRNVWGLMSTVVNTYAGERYEVTLPQKVEYEGYALSADEIERLIQGLKGDRVEVPVLLALWLGLRRSEILGLTWDAYDSEKRTLRISAAMVMNKENQLVTKTTKTTKSTRTLPVPAYIADRLDALEHTDDHIAPIHPSTLLHDLRVSNASVMLLLKVPDKYAMERGGWSSTSVMKRVYQKTLTDERKGVDVLIEEYFNRLADPAEDGNADATQPESE
jgi:integrase